MYYTHMWGIVYRHNISHKQTHNTQGLVGDICTLRPLRNPIECAKKRRKIKKPKSKSTKIEYSTQFKMLTIEFDEEFYSIDSCTVL